jgi:hypothetical protein
MSELQPLHHNFRVTVAAGFACAGIWVIYILGLVAEEIVPFGPPMSLVAVAQNIIGADLSRLSAGFWNRSLGASIIIGTAVLLYALGKTFRRRMLVAAIAFLAPLVLPAVDTIGPMVLMAALLAPLFMIGIVLGMNGEFYAEGFLAFTAVGWWLILWGLLLFREIRFWAEEPFAGNASGKNIRDS